MHRIATTLLSKHVSTNNTISAVFCDLWVTFQISKIYKYFNTSEKFTFYRSILHAKTSAFKYSFEKNDSFKGEDTIPKKFSSHKLFTY